MRFLLVDRIESFEMGVRIAGSKNAAMSEDYFEWHFPERPIVPGMLILESFVQLAGWLEAISSDFGSWFLLDRVHTARYYAFAGPGDRIELALEQVPLAEADRRRYKGESRVAGKRSALVEFEGIVVPLEDLEGAARARSTWATLRGEMPKAHGAR